MTPNPLHQDDLVDRACAAVRQEAEGLDAARTEAALERVRERLGVAPEATGKVLGCAAFTFAKAGQFSYFCSLHPHMTGKVIVKA